MDNLKKTRVVKGVLRMNKLKTITVETTSNRGGAENEQVENYHSKNYE